MAITRTKKELIIKELEQLFKDTASVSFLSFRGLSGSDSTELRQLLRDNGVGYKVIKKTLLNIALDKEKIDGARPIFKEEVAITYGDDLLPLQKVCEFKEKNKYPVEFIGGIFEGKFINADETKEIASIPSIEVLHSRLAYVMKSGLTKWVMALSALAEKK